MSEIEWTNEAAIQLIEEYRKRSELWDPTHDLYRVQTAKYEAWSELAHIFECDIADLRKKLNSLMASHRREKAKVKNGVRSTWFLYEHMKFLPKHLENNEYTICSTQSPKAEYEETLGADSDTSYTEDTNAYETEKVIVKHEPVRKRTIQAASKRVIARPTKRRIVKEVPNSTLDSRLVEALRLLKKSELSRKKDECDSFGEYIATSLRKHDERTQSMIKQAINNILFEQEMKKYSGGPYTVVIAGVDENPLVLGDHDDK